MGRPRKADLPPQADRSFLEEIISDPMEIAQPYLAQAGVDDAEVKFFVYRKVEDGKKPDAFLFKCKPEDFDIEHLGSTYGSGMYRFKVYVKDAQYPAGVIRAGGLLPVEMPPGFKPRPPAETASAAPGADAFQTLFLEHLRRSDERVEKLLAALAAPRAEPNPLATLEGIKAIAEIIRPPQAAALPLAPVAADNFASRLAETRALIDVVKSIGGGEGGEGGGENFLLSKGLDVVAQMVAQAAADKAAKGAPALAAPAAPGAVPAPAAPAPLVNDQEEGEDMLMFRLQLRRACAAARAGDDAAEYGEDVFPFIGDEELKMIAGNEAWFAALVGIEPDCAHFQAWFTTARAKLIERGMEEGILPAKTEEKIVAVGGAPESLV